MQWYLDDVMKVIWDYFALLYIAKIVFLTILKSFDLDTLIFKKQARSSTNLKINVQIDLLSLWFDRVRDVREIFTL